MKRKQLGLLSAVVALVVGYAVYDYQSEKSAAVQKDESSKLFHLSKEGILSIEIVGKHDTVYMTKEFKDGSKWHMEQPLKDDVDEAAVDDFLNEVLDTKYKDVVSENPSDLAVFGLDKPAGKIDLAMSGQRQVLLISEKKNFEGDIYVKYEDQPQVMTTGTLIAIRLDKKAFDYRDRRLFRGIVSEIEEIQFQGGKGRFNLVSKEATWIAKDQPNLKLDQNKVRGFIEKLGDMRATDYLQTGVLDKSPKAMLNFIRNDKSQWQAQFFASADKVFSVKTSEPKQFIKLNPYDAEKVIDTTLDFFRNRAEAFNFDRNDISKVKVTTTKEEVIGVDQDRAKNLIGLLRNAEIADFKSGLQLKKPTVAIVLLNSQGQEIYSLKIAQEMSGPFAASSSSYPETFTVSKDFVDQVMKEIEVEKNEKN